MDLRKFYLENITETEYYYKFFNQIEHVNERYNIFDGCHETETNEFIIFDIEEAIEKFKSLCLPENESHNNVDKCWFYLILFYLCRCGYIIEEFPRLIEHPPVESYDFVNKEIRNKLILDGKDVNGTVRYAERRKLVANLTFTLRHKHIELPEVLEKKFTEISNRDASFQSMSVDEKLAEIVNLIENLLKKDGDFICLDYSKICFEYINDNTIKDYRKRIQCFRHSSEQSIKEREAYSLEQKKFLIDFGLTIIKVIHDLLEEEGAGK